MRDLSGKTFVFISKPGGGKETQSIRLRDLLLERGCDVARFASGDLFREEQKKSTTLGRMIDKMLKAGELPPYWMALMLNVTAISNALNEIKEIEQRVLIIDGAPRRLIEAEAFDQFMDLSDRSKIVPIYLDINDEEAIRRNIERHRYDAQRTEKRLSWFETDVVPVLDYYGDRLVAVNGLGSKDEVFQTLLVALKLD